MRKELARSVLYGTMVALPRMVVVEIELYFEGLNMGSLESDKLSLPGFQCE